MANFLKIAGVVLVSVVLASCGSSRAAQELAAQRAAAKAALKVDEDKCVEGLDNKTHKTMVSYTRCLNDARSRYWAASGFPHSDLIELVGARKLVNAERFDKRKVTYAQYMARDAEIESQLMSAMNQRVNDARIADAAEAQAYAAQRQARAAAQQADASERQARASDRQADAADRYADTARPVIGGIAQEQFRAPRGYRY